MTELPKGTRCAYCPTPATAVEWDGVWRIPVCRTHAAALSDPEVTDE